MSAPFYRHNLSIATALARSGVKGGAIPDFQPAVQPVMLLADMSQTYSGEPLEARGLAGRQTAIVPVGTRTWMRMEARAPGGIVLEDFSANVQGAPTTWIFLDILANGSVPAGAVETSVVVVQTGGAVAASLVFDGSTTSVPSGMGPIDMSAATTGKAASFRVYVPTGFSLCVWSNNVAPAGATNMTFRLQWREIPAPIGLP